MNASDRAADPVVPLRVTAGSMCERTAADRCPGALALHHAQDGFLARVRLPGGRLTADQLRALARAASTGNGLVELTSRANLQLRGFPESAGDELAAILAEAGLLPSAAHDRVRNVIASPLPGRHPRSRAETDSIVDAIDRGLCADPALAGLPGRFLFAVDDGSGIALDHRADVTLIARDEHGYTLALAGRMTTHPRATADVAVAAAAAFLAERRARRADAWRISELAGGAAAVARRIGTEIGGPLPGQPQRITPGRLTQRDGRVALTALAPLGRLDRSDLSRLAAIAAEVRIGTGRTLTLPDLDPATAGGIQPELISLGLVLEPGSGWVGLSACAGLGRCPKARLDVRAAAAVRARVRRPGMPAEHWSACERRCGERADQPVAVAATPAGIAVRTNGPEHLVTNADEAVALLA